MKRKIALLTTAILLGALLLGGCGQKETKKETVDLVVKCPVFMMGTVADDTTTDVYTWLSLAAEDFAKQYTEADVNVRVIQFEVAKLTDAVDGCYDTADAADVLWTSDSNMRNYIYSGHVVPLDDILTDEIRSDFDQTLWDSATMDGKTYMTPFNTSQLVLAYNKDLMHQAGLDEFVTDEQVIVSWTPEEWDTVLSTLRSELPDSVSIMMMYAKDNDLDPATMTLVRSQGSSFFDEDGYVNLETPEGLAGLSWIRECNEKGYFPANAANMVSNDNFELFANNQLVFFASNTAVDHRFDDAGIRYGWVNYPSADGRGFCITNFYGLGVLDNGDEAKEAAAKAFVKYIYESDWLDYSANLMTASKKTMEKYADKLTSLEKYFNNTAYSINSTGSNPNWSAARAGFYPHVADLLYNDRTIEEIAAAIDEEMNAAIREGHEQSTLHE